MISGILCYFTLIRKKYISCQVLYLLQHVLLVFKNHILWHEYVHIQPSYEVYIHIRDITNNLKLLYDCPIATHHINTKVKMRVVQIKNIENIIYITSFLVNLNIVYTLSIQSTTPSYSIYSIVIVPYIISPIQSNIPIFRKC